MSPSINEAVVKSSPTLDSPLSYANAFAHFASLQVAPVSFKVSAYPMERVRLLMQTRHMNTVYEGSSLSSLRRTISSITAEGYLAPWRGVTPTLVRWGPSQYIVLFLKDHLTGLFPNYKKDKDYSSYFFSKVGSGAATGIINALIWAYPLDVVRQQLATKNSGTWRRAVSDIYSQGGVRGFYRGFLMDAPGLALFRGVQLGGWDLVKDHYGDRWGEMSRVTRFAHGQLISLLGSVVSYPYDTIRRNLMSTTGLSYSEVFRSGVITAGGLRSFLYAGFSARVLTSVVNGALLEGFDEWKRTRNA